MRPRGSNIQLFLPNPYRAGAAFLAWLAKQGQDAPFSECEDQWVLSKNAHPTPELDEIKLDKFIKMMGPRNIIQWRKPEGEWVMLTQEGTKWAISWADHYNVGRGHHGGPNPRNY